MQSAEESIGPGCFGNRKSSPSFFRSDGCLDHLEKRRFCAGEAPQTLKLKECSFFSFDVDRFDHQHSDRLGGIPTASTGSIRLNLSQRLRLSLMVIVLVEDDVHFQFFIWKLLKGGGFTVLTAGDGQSALEASRSQDGPIDLLLTEMDLPRTNGVELCKAVSAERPGIKVLIMSGDLRARERVMMSGFPFIQKPFSPAALLESIKETLV
jgi:CheY-like chemotaxis protein